LKIFLFIFFFTPFLCVSQQTIVDSVFNNNLYRKYIIYIPQIYNASNSTPLLFNFHGRGGSSLSAMYNADFRDIADTANFIVVHPKGLLDSNGLSHWNYGNTTSDDIGFINLLYDKLIIDYNIDLKRVYSLGMSNGGAMSYFLACNMNDKIAAIASVTGAMTSFQFSSCNPIHPTPILQIHGTNDTIVSFSSMIFGIEYWKNYNNCYLIADTIIIPDYVLSDSSNVEHIIYKNGDNSVTTELFKIFNGGHTWPGSSFNIGVTNYDIDASIEIWKFFSKYNIYGLIDQTSQLYEFSEQKKLIEIVDIFGRKIKNKNKLFFHIYDDGTVEKKLIIQ
tara:strand:+ start:237 stop:1238 length:1002 start_codon:yes stop_codon:yes gene_type:complete